MAGAVNMDIDLLEALEKKIDRYTLYTVAEVAEICRVSRRTVFNWHNGVRTPAVGVFDLPFCGSLERGRALVQGLELIRFLLRYYRGEALETMFRCPHCGRQVKSV